MARYRTSVHSPAEPDSAFAHLSRFDRAAEWDPGVASGEMLTTGPVGVGSRFRVVTRFAGRSMPLEYAVVEFDAPTRIVLRAETAMLRSVDTITLSRDDAMTGDGQGTRVEYDARLDAKGVLRIADPLIALAFRRIGDRAAAGLRSWLQTVATP